MIRYYTVMGCVLLGFMISDPSIACVVSSNLLMYKVGSPPVDLWRSIMMLGALDGMKQTGELSEFYRHISI